MAFIIIGIVFIVFLIMLNYKFPAWLYMYLEDRKLVHKVRSILLAVVVTVAGILIYKGLEDARFGKMKVKSVSYKAKNR